MILRSLGYGDEGFDLMKSIARFVKGSGRRPEI